MFVLLSLRIFTVVTKVRVVVVRAVSLVAGRKRGMMGIGWEVGRETQYIYMCVCGLIDRFVDRR